MKEIKELKNLLKGCRKSDPEQEEFIDKAESILSDIELNYEYLEESAKEISDEFLTLQIERDQLMKGLHASNMNEEDQIEILNRLYQNLTLNQLLELEKVGKTLNTKYNEYVT